VLTFRKAVVAFFVMNDYPSTAKFLTPEEKTEVAYRLTQDRSSLADEYHTKYMFHALKDWKIWVHMFITIGIYTPLYSVSLFMPTIVRGTSCSDLELRSAVANVRIGLGYTNETAQLMTVRVFAIIY
jgi:hypothetical protein